MSSNRAPLQCGQAAIAVQSMTCGIGSVHMHAPTPGGIPSHPHAHSACNVYVCCGAYPMVRYSLAGQDIRLSPERPGLESQCILDFPKGQRNGSPARA